MGGGGTQCGVTFVCCVITKPTTVPPEADGTCVGKLTGTYNVRTWG